MDGIDSQLERHGQENGHQDHDGGEGVHEGADDEKQDIHDQEKHPGLSRDGGNGFSDHMRDPLMRQDPAEDRGHAYEQDDDAGRGGR